MAYVMASPVTAKLAEEIFKGLKDIRKNPDPLVHTAQITVLMHDVTEVTLNYFFMEPLDLVHIGGFGRKMVQMGIRTGLSLTTTTVDKLIRTLSSQQLLHFADWVESMVLPAGNGEYMLACHVSQEEAQLVFDLAAAVKANPKPGLHTEQIVHAIVSLSQVSLQFFAIDPLDLLNVGSFGKKIVELAVKTGVGIIRGTSKNLIHKLPGNDLIVLVDFFQGLIHPV